MRGSRCTWRRFTAATTTIYRSPASRGWPARCGPRSRSTRGRRTRCPRPRGRSAGERPPSVVFATGASVPPAGLPGGARPQIRDHAMPAFAVFEPPMGRPGAHHTDRLVFLREKFSWGAFLFGALWMIWRRLWLVLLLYLVVLGLIEFGLRRIGIGVEVRSMVFFLVALLVGLEAVSL